jgi:hypothetical protein
MCGIHYTASEYSTGMKIDSSPPVTTTGLEGKEILNMSVINTESTSRHAELKRSAEMRRRLNVACYLQQSRVSTTNRLFLHEANLLGHRL